jgi:LVIVD repeat
MAGFSKLKIFFQIAFFIFVVMVFGSFAFSRDLNRLPCKKLPEGVSRKQIIENIEKYRRGEESILDGGSLGCQEAFPILKKYALDPNPKLREVITRYLGTAYYDYSNRFYPRVLELLLLHEVRIVGNYAYVADGISGLQIINISNPLNPVLTSNFDTPEEANDVVIVGTRG